MFTFNEIVFQVPFCYSIHHERFRLICGFYSVLLHNVKQSWCFPVVQNHKHWKKWNNEVLIWQWQYLFWKSHVALKWTQAKVCFSSRFPSEFIRPHFPHTALPSDGPLPLRVFSRRAQCSQTHTNILYKNYTSQISQLSSGTLGFCSPLQLGSFLSAL